MFLIQSLTNAPTTFGGIAKLILTMILRNASRIYFVIFKKHPSIKDAERNMRRTNDEVAKVTGPDQRSPKDFQFGIWNTVVNIKQCLILLFAVQIPTSWTSCCTTSVDMTFTYGWTSGMTVQILEGI